MSEVKKERDYQKVSPTAWIVAYGRTFTDIPYCREIFGEFEKVLDRVGGQARAQEYNTKGFADITPFFEARYLILNELLKKEGATQIIELAAGLTARGLEFTENPDVVFVEMDLPEISAQKKEIVGNIVKSARPNLYFENGNSLKLEDLDNATSHFNAKKEIAIIHEGFLRYLTFDEKTQLALAIKAELQKFGGAWMTPDIGMKGRQKWANNRGLGSLTGVQDFEANLFDDENHARKFFEDLGFDVKMHKFEEVESRLVSPVRLNIDKEKLKEMLNWRVAFVITLRT